MFDLPVPVNNEETTKSTINLFYIALGTTILLLLLVIIVVLVWKLKANKKTVTGYFKISKYEVFVKIMIM